MDFLKFMVVLFFLFVGFLCALIGYVAATNSCPKELDITTRSAGFVAMVIGIYGLVKIYEVVEFTVNIQL